MAGAKLVLPGPKMGDGEALYQLMDSEEVYGGARRADGLARALLQYCEKAGKAARQAQAHDRRRRRGATKR